jgi:hypothetical protein
MKSTVGEITVALFMSGVAAVLAAIVGFVGAIFLCQALLHGEATESSLVLAPAAAIVFGVIVFLVALRKVMSTVPQMIRDNRLDHHLVLRTQKYAASCVVPVGWSATLPFARISPRKPLEAVCELCRVQLGGHSLGTPTQRDLMPPLPRNHCKPDISGGPIIQLCGPFKGNGDYE